MNLAKKHQLFLFILIVVIGIFYISTIRDGHVWDGDESLYILHAKNIANGTDYSKTGYIFNPYYPTLAPKSFRPILPLILSPVYKLFGLNLNVMKIELILFFLLALIMIFMCFEEYLSIEYRFVMIILIGIHPYFWNFKDNIFTEFPFMLFSYSSLYFINRCYREDKVNSHNFVNAILAAILIFLAYNTRSIGIMLLGSILFYDLLKVKRPRLFFINTTICFILLVIIQRLILPIESNYIDQFTNWKWSIISSGFYGTELNDNSTYLDISYVNAINYFKSFYSVWYNGYRHKVHLIVFLLLTAFGFIGFYEKIRYSPGIYDIYIILYICTIIIYPAYDGIRYLNPILPLFIFYMLNGIQKIEKYDIKYNKVLYAVTIILLMSYAGKYTKYDFGPIKDGINEIEVKDLFKYVLENTNGNDIVIFEKPTILALYTGRSSAAAPRQKNEDLLKKYFESIHANYFVIRQNDQNPKRSFYNNFIQNSKYFEDIYKNKKFSIYKYKNS